MITITTEAVCERGLGWYGVVKVGGFMTKEEAENAATQIKRILDMYVKAQVNMEIGDATEH